MSLFRKAKESKLKGKNEECGKKQSSGSNGAFQAAEV